MNIVKREPDKAYLDTHLWLPKAAISIDAIKSALTHISTGRGGVSQVHEMWKETQHHLLVPRNFWHPAQLPYPVIDCRPGNYSPTDIKADILLDHRMVEQTDGTKSLAHTGKRVQEEAYAALVNNPGGLLVLACGAGKTMVALYFTARINGPVLIVVDNTTLLQQWQEEIEDNLDIPGGLGVVRGTKRDWKKQVVITTYQTLANLAKEASEEFKRWFKLVIWDEGHHVSAQTYCTGAELFYGYRLALTATPDRPDGRHIIYEMHIGPVIYRNLSQDLNAQVVFDYTGLLLDYDAPGCDVIDKTRELHLGKLGVYYGIWQPHLKHVLTRVQQAVDAGRRIIVLCSSTDETVNLCALWNNVTHLYSDVPYPTLAEVGEHTEPCALAPEEKEAREQGIEHLTLQLQSGVLQTSAEVIQAERLIALYQEELEAHRVATVLDSLYRKRQRSYLAWLKPQMTKAGLMIYKVDPKERKQHLDTKQVVFAYIKYGREGLNNRALDTVIATMPFAQANTLQQVKGRVERVHRGKKSPLLLIVEHNIGPVMGMCKKLRKHLRQWPADKGGPLDFTLLGHPGSQCQTTLFGS